ncbi:tRNA pseudouridine synthase A isoform X2 [Brassica rapa]|uniref:tRNA pseudouridine synthase A isoform X2 n=1 Tax=Brassica campestris TaxID=3711 RepID=UPI0004F17E62|nr:tRNA pseudouridine synthase A isoform X2 [Brassica rapa]
MASRVYAHYHHGDACSKARWNTRETFRFMYDRPWQHVLDFYSNAVARKLSVLNLFEPNILAHDDGEREGMPLETELETCGRKDGRTGRWERVNFKILLSYNGASFDGWQKQPDLHTVQSVVEKSLGAFVDEKKAQLLKKKCKPLEGRVLVAGRTDKGVSALNQVCSFYTWRKDIEPIDIEDAINKDASGKLRVVSVSKVSREFHPNFSAKWRRYLYIFPLDHACGSGKDRENLIFDENLGKQRNGLLSEENTEGVGEKDDELETEEVDGAKPSDFSVSKVDQLLQQLQGKLLSYKMFARDLKAARNEGPPTECFMYHARAAEIRLPSPEYVEGRRVMCVELVANRFLRKMVRVLVATSIREAAAGAENDALLKLVEASCRRATAPPAPSEGLCLFDVGYVDFDPHSSLIS